jgi:hypothetical protein
MLAHRRKALATLAHAPLLASLVAWPPWRPPRRTRSPCASSSATRPAALWTRAPACLRGAFQGAGQPGGGEQAGANATMAGSEVVRAKPDG